MALARIICAPLGTLSTFSFNPVFQLSTAKNEMNLFNNHVLIVAPVTFAPAGVRRLPRNSFFLSIFFFKFSRSEVCSDRIKYTQTRL